MNQSLSAYYYSIGDWQMGDYYGPGDYGPSACPNPNYSGYSYEHDSDDVYEEEETKAVQKEALEKALKDIVSAPAPEPTNKPKRKNKKKKSKARKTTASDEPREEDYQKDDNPTDIKEELSAPAQSNPLPAQQPERTSKKAAKKPLHKFTPCKFLQYRIGCKKGEACRFSHELGQPAAPNDKQPALSAAASSDTATTAQETSDAAQIDGAKKQKEASAKSKKACRFWRGGEGYCKKEGSCEYLHG